MGPSRPRCWFVNESGAIAFVKDVDTGHAHLFITTREGSTAHFAMPIAEYDSRFTSVWRPAEVDDMRTMESDKFRLPANAPADWAE